MAIQAQFGGLPLAPIAAEEQIRALKDYGALLPVAAAVTAADRGYACQQYDYCAAQSELTRNGVGGGAAMSTTSRKRGREDELLHYSHYSPFLPLPGIMRPNADSSPATAAAASTSGRAAEAPAAAEHALAASELWRRHSAEVDALVRVECDRLRVGLELARERQRQALVRAAAVSGSGSLARWAREAEAQLQAARQRAAELEERVRQAAAEAQAWRGVAQGNEAVAAGLRATLDALLLRSVATAAAAAAEGFGESEPDDALSCCCYAEEQATDTDAATAAGTALSSSSSPAWNGKWACRACGEREASVLVLPCRHLCLCKACEPRTDACPVCLGAKNASIHIAPNTIDRDELTWKMSN